MSGNMKSVKPGRGHSLSKGIEGLVFLVIIGALIVGIWNTYPKPLVLIMLLIIFAVGRIRTAIYFFNAFSKHRFSSVDIVDGGREADPIEMAISQGKENSKSRPEEAGGNAAAEGTVFCPWCGKEVRKGWEYCPHCGKRIPENLQE